MLYFLSFSVSKQFKMFFRPPKFQHFFLLLKFFTLSVMLLSMDIITDINTAVDFLSRGHFYWGICTVVPIFAPFAVKILMNIVNLCRCYKVTIVENSCLLWRYRPKLNEARLSFSVRETKQLIWHFPMLQPIR
jgi:hypothetical protein